LLEIDQDETDVMSCTIVIPHKDRLGHLRWTLRALKMQTTQHYFDVIVVDDGSEVRPDMVLKPSDLPVNIRFINQNNMSAGSARNAGWMASDQDIVIFLDCDQIVSPRFVENHLVPFHQTPASFVQLGTRRHLKPDYKVDLNTIRQEQCHPDERIFFFRKTSFNLANLEITWHLGFSHNMSLRRRDLALYGGFDESFIGWGFEDCELTYRMKHAGVPPVLNPAIEACHQSHSQRMTPQKFQLWLKNLSYFMKKCPTADVDVQKALIPVCDPAVRPSIRWTNALLQMETLLRLSRERPLQHDPLSDVACVGLDDLYALASSPDCDQKRALIAPTDISLFIQSQLDPALREVRIFPA
jgi:GT2 family glycosyltransferase